MRYNDVDERGVVNNAVYVTYLEEARVAWFRAVNREPGANFAGKIIIARVEIDYRDSLVLHDAARVELAVAEIGRSSFALNYAVYRAADGRRMAEGRSVQVHFDYAGRRSLPLSGVQRKLLQRYRAIGGRTSSA